MFTELSIRNLTCFGEPAQSIELKPLTIIVGSNNTGKSAIVNALNMLVNHVRGTDPLTYYYPRPFSLLDIIHMKDPNKTISIEARHDNPNKLLQLDINHNTRGTPSMTPGVDQNFLQNYIYISALRGIITPYVEIGGNRQSIDPRGSNIIQFFLERFTDRDERWNEAEYWIRKIDPSLRLLKLH